MKLKIIITILGFSLLAACTTTDKHRDTLLQPEVGVLCDQFICVDQNGVSQTLTAKYLGQSRAEILSTYGKYDITAMTFANGIFCDTSTKLCHVDRYFEADGKRSAISQKYTEKLFGQM